MEVSDRNASVPLCFQRGFVIENVFKENRIMEITFIGHSCFLIELPDVYLLFDYYRGELRN